MAGGEHHNAFGQPIGAPLPDWQAPPAPAPVTLEGRTCRLVPLAVDHTPALFAAWDAAPDGRDFTYLATEPFSDEAACRAWAARVAGQADPLFFTVIDRADDSPVGVASLMRIAPAAGCIEVGNIHFSRRMQRTPLGTEAIVLLAEHVFGLGYRRFEWKCDALNAPSRAAAERLGFTFEGVFRQALVTKGRNRDTAWYSMLDGEWPRLRAAFTRWLDPGNFDDQGRQHRSLGDLRGGRGS